MKHVRFVNISKLFSVVYVHLFFRINLLFGFIKVSRRFMIFRLFNLLNKIKFQVFRNRSFSTLMYSANM